MTLHPGDGEPQKLDKIISKIIIDKRDNLDLNNFDMACDHDVFEGKNIIDLCSLNSIYILTAHPQGLSSERYWVRLGKFFCCYPVIKGAIGCIPIFVVQAVGFPHFLSCLLRDSCLAMLEFLRQEQKAQFRPTPETG